MNMNDAVKILEKLERESGEVVQWYEWSPYLQIQWGLQKGHVTPQEAKEMLSLFEGYV